MDSKLKDSLLTLHEIQVEEEKESIKEATAGINTVTELSLEASNLINDAMDLEDEIKETIRQKRRFKMYSGICACLSVIVLVARLIAWNQ